MKRHLTDKDMQMAHMGTGRDVHIISHSPGFGKVEPQ